MANQSHRWSRKGVVVVLLVVAATLLAGLELLDHPRISWRSAVEETEALSGRIETLMQATSRLPEPDEVGMRLGPVYYDPQDDGGYRIGFCSNFDVCHDYHPAADRWHWQRQGDALG